MERCSLPSVAILSAAANKNERGGMRSRQYRLEEGSVGARNGRIEGKPAHDWDYPCTRRTHGSGRRLWGTSRRGSGADSVRPVAVGRKKAGPAAKNGFGKRADSRRATRKRAVASRIGPMRVARKRNALRFPRIGSDAHLFVGGRWMCVWKSEPIGGSKVVFQGSPEQTKNASPPQVRRRFEIRSTCTMELSWKRFVFPGLVSDHVETLGEGLISHVRSHTCLPKMLLQNLDGPRLFCNSRPQAARCPGPRAEPTGARREEEWRATYSSAADESRRTRRATGSDRARSSPSSGLGPIAKDRRHRAEAATNNRGTWVSGAPSAARTCAAPRR